MATIVLRSVKGSPLTIQEVDSNFSNINDDLANKLNSTDYTASDVLTKIKTVDGLNSGLDADLVRGKSSSTSATSDTLVVRDSSGNINATTFTGNVIGNLTGNVTGNASTATTVSGLVSIVNGGTGATSAAAARSNLGLGSLSQQDSSNVSITGGSISLTAPLEIGSGGTGGSTAAQARVNLGLVLGVNVQQYSAELSSLAGSSSTGFYVRTGTASVSQRSIAVGNNGLVVSNGSGVAGNPTIDISSNANISISSITSTTANITTVTSSSITKSGTSGVGNIGQTNNRFGTVYTTAVSAVNADLAEKYTTKETYSTGTVIAVCDCEDHETECSWKYGQKVVGVVSTAPAITMNEDSTGQAIALKGRVPVRVLGRISKGQVLMSAPGGVAVLGDQQVGFAIALETNLNDSEKLVECVIL